MQKLLNDIFNDLDNVMVALCFKLLYIKYIFLFKISVFEYTVCFDIV